MSNHHIMPCDVIDRIKKRKYFYINKKKNLSFWLCNKLNVFEYTQAADAANIILSVVQQQHKTERAPSVYIECGKIINLLIESNRLIDWCVCCCARSVLPQSLYMKWAHNLRADTENVCVFFFKKILLLQVLSNASFWLNCMYFMRAIVHASI